MPKFDSVFEVCLNIRFLVVPYFSHYGAGYELQFLGYLDIIKSKPQLKFELPTVIISEVSFKTDFRSRT